MIIILGGFAASAVDLPNLNIQDSATLSHIPVGGLDGADGDFIQAQAICTAPMEFSAPYVGSAAGFITDDAVTQRLSKVLLRVSFSASATETAVIKPFFIDANDVVSIGADINVTATAETDGTNFLAELIEVIPLGAVKMRFRVESVSLGTIDLSLAGI